MKQILKIIVILLFFVHESQGINIDESNSSQNQFIDDFAEINNIIKKRYSHLENKQIDADSLFRVYSEHIQAAKTKEEYYYLLLAYFAELKNGHTRLHYSPSYYLSCIVKLVENRIFIDNIDNSLADMDINIKDEILAVDGIPVLKWINQQQKLVSESTEEAIFNNAAKQIFSDYSGGVRTLLLNTPTGEKEVSFTFEKNRRYVPTPAYKVTSSVINDSIGYICIYSMTGNVVSEFIAEFENLRTKPFLIIDLRYNGGGNSGYSEKITKYLIREKQKASVSRFNLKPKSNHYKGKLVVLTGINTFSAAESFAIDLMESGNAILIGSETRGDTGNRPKQFKTKQGTSFQIPTRKPPQVSPKGFPMEGIGIKPHFTINQTVEDYLNDVDTVLEFAKIKFLEMICN